MSDTSNSITGFLNFALNRPFNPTVICDEGAGLVTVIVDLSSSFKPFHTNRIYHKATYNKARTVQCIQCRVTGYYFQNKVVFLSMKIFFFVFANGADPDKILYYVAFHLGIQIFLDVVSSLQKCVRFTIH